MRRVLALLLAAGLLTTPALAAETPAEEPPARGEADQPAGEESPAAETEVPYDRDSQ